MMSEDLQGKKIYFYEHEFWAAISKIRLAKTIQIRDHEYTSGANYSGEWLGGFRHGKGTMTWKDGGK